MHDFVTENTKNFFNTLLDPSTTMISLDFLQIDPSLWYENAYYLQAEEIVKHTLVVNDIAERTIALATNFNDKFTKNEEKKQQIFQVVESHRKEFPNRIRKKNVVSKLRKS